MRCSQRPYHTSNREKVTLARRKYQHSRETVCYPGREARPSASAWSQDRREKINQESPHLSTDSFLWVAMPVARVTWGHMAQLPRHLTWPLLCFGTTMKENWCCGLRRLSIYTGTTRTCEKHLKWRPEKSRQLGRILSSRSIQHDTLRVLDGRLPHQAWGLVVEWGSQHKEELMRNWEDARNKKPLRKIEPLP